MPRPKNKQELETLSSKNYKKLIDFVNSFSPEQQEGEFPPQYLNRNIRDVLCHLHHWHLMFFNWYEIGMEGKKPQMPAEGYSWKDTKQLNIAINKKYKSINLASAKNMLQESFDQIQTIIVSHTDAELFEKKRFDWTGTTSLGAYLVSATSSHYEWAFKLIKKYKKAIEA